MSGVSSVSRMTSALAFVLCIALVTTPFVAQPCLAQLRSLRFGFFGTLGNYTHTDGRVQAPHWLGSFWHSQLHAGISAAFKEAMDNRVIDSTGATTLDIVWQNVPSAIGFGNLTKLTEDGMNFGVIAPIFSTSTRVVESARTLNFPAIGGGAAESSLPNKVRQGINLRSPYLSEALHLLRYGAMSKLRCTRWGLMVYNVTEIVIGVHALLETMRKLGYDSAGDIPVVYGDADVWQKDPKLVLPLLAQFPFPHCIVGLMPPDSFMVGIVILHNVPGFNADETSFFTISSLSLAKFEALGESRYFKNLYVSQQFPFPSDTSYGAVQSYQAAMAALGVSGYNPGFQAAPVVRTDIPNYYSFEGYLTGRFVVEVLRHMRTDEFNPQRFIDTVYRTRMFEIDDIPLGPYSDRCSRRRSNLSDIPCFCNCGLKSVFMARVNGVTGTLDAVNDDPARGEVGVAVSQIPTADCIPNLERLQRPFLFINVALTNALGARERAFTDSLAHAFGVIEEQRRTVQASPIVLSLERYTSPSAYSTGLLASLVKRYVPMAFLGVTASPIILAAENLTAPVLGRMSQVMPLSDPPVSAWRRFDVAVEAVLADHVHALVAGVASDKASVSLVIGSTPEEAQLGKQSSITFQFKPAVAVEQTPGGVLSKLTAASGVVLVISQDPAVVLEVLRFSSSRGGAGPMILLATNEDAIHDAVVAVGRGALVSSTVRFASVLGAWWSNTTAAQTVVSAFNRLYQPLTPGALRRPAELLAFRLAFIALKAGESVYGPPSTPVKLLDGFYSTGSVNVLDISLGRFSDAPCPAGQANTNARTCQCSKGPRSFHVHSLKDMAVGEVASASFVYSLIDCGVVYKPLTTNAELDIIAIAVAVPLAAMTVIVGIVLAVRASAPKTRDNRAAPKDGSRPFTICFTDIQSSTNLWARVPEDMSSAVETHHALIRELIVVYRGYEVKTIGDSFMVAFDNPRRAVEFSLALQTKFNNHEWPSSAISQTYLELEAEMAEEAAAAAKADVSSQSSQLSNRVTGGGGEDATPDFGARRISNASTPEAGVGAESPARSAAVSAFTLSPFWNGLRVRVGVHYGSGNIKLDPVSLGYDYYGTVVNTAARVEGVGNGGQVLITEAVRDAVMEGASLKLPIADVVELPLGPQPLRGLEAPVVLYQLQPSSLSGRTFGPLRLDIEIDEPDNGDSDASSAESTISRGSSTLSSAKYAIDRSVETLADKAAKVSTRRGVSTQMAVTAFMTNFFFLKTLLGTSNAKYRGQTMDHLCTKWRVPKDGNDGKGKKNHESLARLMKLVVRVAPAADAAAVKAKVVAMHEEHAYEQRVGIGASPLSVVRSAAWSLLTPGAGGGLAAGGGGGGNGRRNSGDELLVAAALSVTETITGDGEPLGQLHKNTRPPSRSAEDLPGRGAGERSPGGGAEGGPIGTIPDVWQIGAV